MSFVILGSDGNCSNLLEYALHKVKGYGAAPRRPLLPLKESEGEKLILVLRELFDLEAELEKAAKCS